MTAFTAAGSQITNRCSSDKTPSREAAFFDDSGAHSSGGNDLYDLYLRFAEAEKSWIQARLRQNQGPANVELSYVIHSKEHFFERLKAMDSKSRDRYCYNLRRGNLRSAFPPPEAFGGDK